MQMVQNIGKKIKEMETKLYDKQIVLNLFINFFQHSNKKKSYYKRYHKTNDREKKDITDCLI